MWRLIGSLAVCIALGLSAVAVGYGYRAASQQWELRLRIDQLQTTVSSNYLAQVDNNRRFSTMLRAAEFPWATSEDQKVQVRLTPESDMTRPGFGMIVLVEVRNATDAPLIVDRPSLRPWDLRLYHDGQLIPYDGPTPATAPPPPVQLEPGRTVATFADLQHFPILARETGQFTLEYRYESGEFPPNHSWKGSVGPIQVHWTSY